MGKTALALQMAKAMAEESPIVFFSLEMSRKMLLLRLICGEAKVNTEKVRRGTMTADERERVNHATSRITDLPLIIFDDQKGKPTIPQMGAFLVKVEREYGKPKAFFLDHIGELVGGSEDDTANTSKAARALRAMRNKHDVTPIILSQLNRSCEARNNKRPTMSDLKNSGTLEEVGDMIFFLYRDEYYNPGGESAGQAELILAKYRDGETGTVILGFSEGVFHDRQTSNW
jgi:replicative DNA helicase